MKNLSRIDNYLNKQDAWKAWLDISKQAHMANRTDLVRKYEPADNAGWRKIDKATSALAKELAAVEHTLAGGQGVCSCTSRGSEYLRGDEWVCSFCHLPLAANASR